MKKYLLIFLSVLVAVMILLISMVRCSRQQYLTGSRDYNGLVSSNSAVLRDYDLPYPGMLPDNPLYFVKMLRDRVKLMLVGEDLEKINLLLFYADKRIAAADALLREGQVSLAEITAHKAEQYMGQAMSMLRDFNEEEKSKNIDLFWKFYRSATIHNELINQMSLMVEGDARVSMEKVVKNCDVYRAEIMGILEIEESEIKEGGKKVNDVEEEEFGVEEGYL